MDSPDVHVSKTIPGRRFPAGAKVTKNILSKMMTGGVKTIPLPVRAGIRAVI